MQSPTIEIEAAVQATRWTAGYLVSLAWGRPKGAVLTIGIPSDVRVYAAFNMGPVDEIPYSNDHGRYQCERIGHRISVNKSRFPRCHTLQMIKVEGDLAPEC